jgi:hypothetical protein
VYAEEKDPVSSYRYIWNAEDSFIETRRISRRQYEELGEIPGKLA